jgi:hypothetical protein
MKLIHAFLWAIALTLIAVPLAFAWPDQPPDSATISGPGLKGNVAITDPAILAALKLGNVEDFTASVPEPISTVRYTIHRVFENSFDFGTLTYVPADGGYVYFEDGASMENHTPYHDHWYRITPAGQRALTGLLPQIAPVSAAVPLPAPNNAVVWPWTVTLCVALILVGLLTRRSQPV